MKPMLNQVNLDNFEHDYAGLKNEVEADPNGVVLNVSKKTAGEMFSPAVFFGKKTGIMASIHSKSGRKIIKTDNVDSKKSNAFQKPKFYKFVYNFSRLVVCFSLCFQYKKGKR